MGESALKRVLLLAMGVLLFLNGCSVFSSKEETILTGKINDLREEPNLTSKDYQHEVKLIDGRNEEVVKTLKPFEYDNEEKYQEDVKSLTEELATGIDQPMIPAKISGDGKLIAGQSRVILDEVKLIEQLSDVSIFNREIVLPITETAPNVSEEQLEGLDEAVLGSFTTRFNPSVKNRNTNIEISAKEIDNIVLGPGDRFYFNTIVGDSTPDKGYKMATVIVNKQFVDGYGGGVCQTSSTLYNAVENAGLEILELHHHSKEVGYVPKGKDATIAYGFKDFKFANNNDFPVVIKTIYNESSGSLEVRVTSSAKLVASN